MALMPRLAKTLLIIAAVPLVLLAGWQRVIEPALVKIPGDVNRTNNYSGTVSVFVDQKSAIDLPAPQESPMSILRTAKSVPGSTGSATTSLRETDHISLLGQNVEQSYVFVLDRSSARNVFSEQSTAYGNNVNRRGAYYPNLPFGVDNSRLYQIWNNEAGTAYVVERDGGPATATINGVKVLRMRGALRTTPVASYYTGELTKLGLPSSLTPAQLQAQFAASGVDASATLAALGNVLSPSETATLIGTLGNNLPLQYYTALTAEARVEPTTGIVVWTHSVKSFFVAPDPTALAPVKKILDSHSSDPVVKAVDDYFTTLSKPRAAFTLDYTTNRASADSMASYAKSQREKLRLAQLYAPAGLLLLFVALCFGAWLSWSRRHEPPASSEEPDLVDVREPTKQRAPAGV
jgi:Porin PorA